MLKEQVIAEIKKLNKHKKVYKAAGLKHIKFSKGSTQNLLKKFSTAMRAIDSVLMIDQIPESCISLFENNIDLMLNPETIVERKQLITIENKAWTEEQIGENMKR